MRGMTESSKTLLFPGTAQTLLVEEILSATGLEARPTLHTDDVDPGVAHCKQFSQYSVVHYV